LLQFFVGTSPPPDFIVALSPFSDEDVGMRRDGVWADLENSPVTFAIGVIFAEQRKWGSKENQESLEPIFALAVRIILAPEYVAFCIFPASLDFFGHHGPGLLTKRNGAAIYLWL
jgi:hypothetical protein